MRNLGERVDIAHGVRADDGTKLEPEEQPVRRVIATTADVKHGVNPTGAALRTSLTTEMNADEASRIMSEKCHLCAHWRPDEWPAVKRKLQSTPDGQAMLNRIRGEMLAGGAAAFPGMENGDDLADVEHALGSAGVCKALSDLFRDDMITMPDATCPETDPHGQPLPTLFVARRGDARRAATSTRDTILRTAQGRK